jgi:hypothetical protein
MSRSAPTIRKAIFFPTPVASFGRYRISSLSDRRNSEIPPGCSHFHQSPVPSLGQKGDHMHDSVLEFRTIFHHSEPTELPFAH